MIYWVLAAAVTLRPEWDAYFHRLRGICCRAHDVYEVSGKIESVRLYASGFLQGLAHACAVILLAKGAAALNADLFVDERWYDVWLWLLALLVEVGILGGLIGAFLFGLNLLITCRWCTMNDNDAFSALRLDTYRNFLRIRIKGNEVAIYAIGLAAIRHGAIGS